MYREIVFNFLTESCTAVTTETAIKKIRTIFPKLTNVEIVIYYKEWREWIMTQGAEVWRKGLGCGQGEMSRTPDSIDGFGCYFAQKHKLNEIDVLNAINLIMNGAKRREILTKTNITEKNYHSLRESMINKRFIQSKFTREGFRCQPSTQI